MVLPVTSPNGSSEIQVPDFSNLLDQLPNFVNAGDYLNPDNYSGFNPGAGFDPINFDPSKWTTPEINITTGGTGNATTPNLTGLSGLSTPNDLNNIDLNPAIVASQNTLWGKIQSKFGDKWQSVKDEFNKLKEDPSKIPSDAFHFALKQIGIEQDEKTGHWLINPFTVVGDAATLGGSSLLGLPGLIDKVADFFDVKLPRIDMSDLFNTKGDVPLTDSLQSQPSTTDPTGQEFIPNDPYTTDAKGNTIPDTRDFTVIPSLASDGTVSQIIVGKNDGSGVMLLTPDDFSKYGITPDNISTYDFDALFPSGNNGNQPPPNLQTGNPDGSGTYPGEPGYDANNIVVTAKPPVPPDVNTPANPPQDNPPDTNVPPVNPVLPPLSPGAGGGSVGSGDAPPPASPVTPPATPTTPAAPQSTFNYFKMPEFKLLNNGFGHPILQMNGQGGSSPSTNTGTPNSAGSSPPDSVPSFSIPAEEGGNAHGVTP